MRSPLTSSAGILFALTGLALGCERDEITELATSQLTVVTTTAGNELDPDGYAIQVDEAGPQPIGANGQLEFDGLQSGDHSLILSGIADNCSAAEGYSQTVTVAEGAVTEARFTVTCWTEGRTLDIRSETGGVDLDQDGYTVLIDGGAPRSIEPNGSVQVAELERGSHSVQVEGVAANCTVAGENPRVFSIAEDQTAILRLQITCEVIRGSRIAFSSFRSGEYDIFTVRLDGTALVNLTAEFPGSSLAPAWSPDGSRIAFIGGSQHLNVMNADGTGLTDLTPHSSHLAPVWSPDGRTIMTSGGSVVLVNADGSGQRFLTSGGCATWSPDGERIVFAQGGRLFTISRNGLGQQGLTAPPLDEFDCEPRWSPDGTRIAFVRSDAEDGDGFYTSNLWVVNADGTNPRKLTNFFLRGPGGTTGGYAWSPDGTKLALSCYVPGGDDILLLDPAGGEPVNLTNDHSWREFQPVWSSDGQQILYEARPVDPETLIGGPPEVFVMDSDGSNRRNLTNDPSYDYGGAWQP